METLQGIWTELGGRLRRFIGNRVRDAATADDITQDVLVKVQEQLHALPEGEKLPAWLFATARNAVTDHYRSSAVRNHADIGEIDPAADVPDAERESAIRDLTPCLTRMIEQLPEPYREAMRLADLEGIDQQEIAARAGISLSGAKSRVQRARQQLRVMIEDCCKIEKDARGNPIDFQRTYRSSRYCGENDGKAQCDS